MPVMRLGSPAIERTRVPLGRILRAGAVAGLAAGMAGAIALWFLVEPKLQQAIALEDGEGPTQFGGADEHAVEVIGRGAQVVTGLIVIVIVGLFLGLIFGVVYSWTHDRLPGAHHFGKSLLLAGLTFLVVAVGPAVMLPANPPGVGEAGTVTGRSQAYLFVLGFLVILVVGCFAVLRGRGSVAARGTAAVTIVVAAVIVIVVAVADVGDGIPEGFPAGLLWDFRMSSLAQHAIMWLTIGVVFGWAAAPPAEGDPLRGNQPDALQDGRATPDHSRSA